MIKIHRKIEQGSEEWFDLRAGKMTASHAQAIGNHGKGLDTYIVDMMAEFYSSGEAEQFSNKHTDRGNELEPVARQVYEFENDVEVDTVGFIEYNEYIGVSPDGLVGEDGGIEIKCVDDTAYFKHLLNGESEIDSKYIWQVQMSLKVTGRKWWDLVIYNPNYTKSMCVYRIVPDEEKFAELEIGFAKGIELINNIKNKINVQ